MKIDETKLEELHEYIEAGGATDDASMFAILGEDDSEALEAYKKALAEKYPETYDYTPQKKRGPKPKAEQPKVEKVILFDESGIGKELEIFKNTGDTLYVRVVVPPKPKDLVTVKIGGKDVEIDLLELAEESDKTKQVHGLSVATLLMLGKIAKGE